MDRSPRCWTGLAITLALAGCQTHAGGAKEKFSEENTCPEDRVESRDRPDLRRSSFETGGTTGTAKPPADIAADPERLAMWQKRHQQDPTQFDDLDDIEEAHGCGKDAFYFCHRMRQHANRVTCGRFWYPVPTTISHW